MVFILFCCCWMLGTPVVGLPVDGTLVFKNGKKMAYQGSYSVEGKFVSFKTKKGQLYKIPLDLVDLEATEGQVRKKKNTTSKPKNPEPKKEKSLAELMGLEDDGAESRSIEIKTDEVEGYVDKDTLRAREKEQNRQKWDSYTKPSNDRFDAWRKYYRDTIRNLKKQEIETIKTMSEEKKELQHLNRTIPHESLSDLDEVEKQRRHQRQIDYKESKLEDLNSQLIYIRKRIKEITGEAKERGVNIR